MRLTVGKGEKFERIEEALKCAEKYADEEVTIHIQAGTYHEKLEIRQAGVVLEGEGADRTVITYDDYANDIMPDGEKRGTFRSYTMLVDAPGVRLMNLTIENAAGARPGSGQTVALYAEGEGIVVRNCRIVSDQDTLFTGPLPPKEVIPGGFRGPKEFAPRINGRQFYFDCYICGGVDFIFGSATAYFENCTLESLPHPGFVTAGSSPEGQEFGYVFSHCRFIGDESQQNVFLGRPWREYAKVVIMNSYLGGHIQREGWNDWKKEKAHETAFFAEYQNYGPGAEGQRVEWSHQLTAEEAKKYALENIAAGRK